MTTTTINYKSGPPSTSQNSAIIVNGGDADNSDATQNTAGRFTVFYGDKDASGDVITSPTTVINGSGAEPTAQPQNGLNGGSVTGADKIQIRRDVEENWQSVNPVLCHGELAFSTNTKALKIGPGNWADLPNILECAPYTAHLAGNCFVVNASTHGQGNRPDVSIFAPDGSLVSVCVTVDSAGTVEIASSHDLTGFTAVIRA